MRPTVSTYVIAWLWAVTFLVAAFWSNFAAAPIPLPGLAQVVASEHRVPMAIFLLGSAVWYSMPRYVTEGRLQVFLGACIALAIVGFWAVSVPFGIACAFLAHSAAARKGWARVHAPSHEKPSANLSEELT